MTKQKMSQKIAVLNQKGGVGKTTTVINLAAYMGKAGKRILVIDLDPQGNATSGLGIDKATLHFTTLDVLDQSAKTAQSIVSLEMQGVHLLPTNADLAGAEVSLVGQESRELRLRQAIDTVAHDYDIILIDCPPSLGLLTINALAAADSVIVPVQAEYYAMEGLGQLMQVIQRVQSALNPSLSIRGVLITMYDSRTSLSEQVRAELERVFGDLVYKTVVPRNVRLAEAPSHGKPILYYDKWSKGARAYRQIAKEVLQHGNA